LELSDVATVLAGHRFELVLVLHAFPHELGLLLSCLNGTNTSIAGQILLFFRSVVLYRQAFTALISLKTLLASPLHILRHLLAKR